MKRSLRQHATTLILVALALTAAVTVFVIDRGAVSTDESELRKKNLLEAWRPDEITELTVEIAPEGPVPGAVRTARLAKDEANDAGQRTWSVTIDGQRYSADEQAVDQYLGTLEFATAERRVSAASSNGADPAADRAALGLAAPRIVVTLAMGSRRDRLAIGGSAPSPPGASYAEVAGRGVFVITKQLAAALDVPLDRFRSKSFVPYLSTELSALGLDGEGGARRFVRAPWGGGRGGGFRFAEGAPPQGGARVSAAAMDGVLASLGRMQAEAFLSEEQAQRSAKTRVTLTLFPSDPAAKRAVIDLGGACPDKPEHVVAVRREPDRAAVCVPASALDALVGDASGFLDLAVVAAPLDEIAEVKLAAGARTLELARTEAEWHLRAPEDRALATEVGRAAVQAILDVRATRLVAPAPADGAKALGLDPPRATLRVVSTPPKPSADGEPTAGDGDRPAPLGERVETLEIGAEQAGVVYVRRLEDGAIAEVPAAAAGALSPSELALRPVQVLDFPAARVRALRIERDGSVQRLRRAGEDAWQLVEPTGEGLTADAELAEAVAQQLGALKAERWAPSGTDGSFGLGAPRLAVEAELAPEGEGSAAPDAGAAKGKTVRVELGAAAGAGSFARTGDSPAVFVAPAALEAAAGRWLLDRGIFAVAPADVARVTLTPEGGKPIVVEGSPRGWTIAGAADDAASAARAAGVRDALADLRAEGAVSLGRPEKQHGLAPPRLQIVVERAPPQGALRIAIGMGDAFRGTGVYYARRDGVSATYAIAQSRVRPLLEAAGVAAGAH